MVPGSKSASDGRCCFHWNAEDFGIIQGNGTIRHNTVLQILRRVIITHTAAQHFILIHENEPIELWIFLSKLDHEQ
jgi:hypothetical protein